MVDDLFASNVAFAALLNFPLTRLADRLRDGAGYSRRTWAEVRLTGRFDTRIPGALAMAKSAAEAAAEQYIAGYNLWMHHVLGEGGERRFPLKKRLIVHPSQVAEVAGRHPEIARARLVVEGELTNDRMTLKVVCASALHGLAEAIAASVRDVTKLRSEVALVAPGALPNDGKVIEDAPGTADRWPWRSVS